MKQKITLLLILLVNFSFAQDHLEIPFEYKNNLIYIKVEIDGKKQDFIFDTGAVNLFTKKFADSKKLILKKSRRGQSYFGKIKTFKTTLKNFSPFGKNLKNVNFRVIDLNYLNKLNVAGLIGAETVRMLGYTVLTIDYKNQKLIFGNQRPEKYDFIFNMYKGYPRIVLDKTKFLIDTGNSLYGESNSKRFITNKKCDQFSNYSLTISNHNINKCENLIQDLSGKSFTFNYFLFEKNRKNVIGNLVLQNYLVQIDFENRKLFFTNNEFYPMPNDIYFSKDDKGFFVTLINESSELYKMGVKEGEYLENVIGLDLNKLKNVAELHRFILTNEKTDLVIRKSDNSLLQLKNITIN